MTAEHYEDVDARAAGPTGSAPATGDKTRRKPSIGDALGEAYQTEYKKRQRADATDAPSISNNNGNTISLLSTRLQCAQSHTHI